MEQAFSQIAHLYDSCYADKDYKKEVDGLMEWLKPGMRVLDVGCGTGRHAELLVQRGVKVVGIEPSLEMADVAVKRVKIPLYAVSIQEIPRYIGGQFDAIVAMFDVLDYVISPQDYRKAMVNINRLLKKGGLFFYEGWNKAIKPTYHREKKFMYKRKVWYRDSYTSRKGQIFEIRFVYAGQENPALIEDHYLRPRLTVNPDLSRYGFALVDKIVDPYSVKAWFVKAKSV